jgi:hypothetical protein
MKAWKPSRCPRSPITAHFEHHKFYSIKAKSVIVTGLMIDVREQIVRKVPAIGTKKGKAGQG